MKVQDTIFILRTNGSLRLEVPILEGETFIIRGKPSESKSSNLFFDFEDGKGAVPAHRHINPDGSIGGWVANTAYVADTVYVGGNARVFGNAIILQEVKIYDNCCVFENAYISCKVQLYGNVKVKGNAVLFEEAKLYDNVQIYDNAVVRWGANIYNDVRIYGKALITGEGEIKGSVSIFNGIKYLESPKVKEEDNFFLDIELSE